MKKLKIVVLLALLTAATLRAQVTLPKILASHMVVQRDLPVHVWGAATPGEQVSVSFRGETRAVTAGTLGRWSVYLKPGEAGGPFELTVKGTPANGAATPGDSIALEDVLVGDVWVASGQSNMEFMMSQAATAADDLPKAGNDQIRLLIVKKRTSAFPLDDVETDGWAASSPDTAKIFSAAGWYFAREIEQREHVPVGMIDSTWGGTPAEAWTRMQALGADGALAPELAAWGKMTETEPDALLVEKDHQRQREEARAAGKPEPVFPWHRDLLSWGPGNLYNAMIAPLTPMAIRGAIWYQGESNAEATRGPLYKRTMTDLIEDWRQQWGVGDFPFIWVQLANYKPGSPDWWPVLRDQQLKTLALSNTGMAVTIDIGNPDNIHPTDKLDVGLRLALWARALSYGEDVSYSGPLFREAVPDGAAMRVWFSHHAKGLVAKGGDLTGFEVAAADGKFVAATATIDGNTVVVSSPAVTEPAFVRYGWTSNPACNLYNGEGLPASPFTSVR